MPQYTSTYWKRTSIRNGANTQPIRHHGDHHVTFSFSSRGRYQIWVMRNQILSMKEIVLQLPASQQLVALWCWGGGGGGTISHQGIV